VILLALLDALSFLCCCDTVSWVTDGASGSAVNKTRRLKTKTREGKTNTKTKTAVDKTDFQDQDIRLSKKHSLENGAKKYFEKFSHVII